jgi:hypothetical protein
MNCLNVFGKYGQASVGFTLKSQTFMSNAALITTKMPRSLILFSEQFRINFIGQLPEKLLLKLSLNEQTQKSLLWDCFLVRTRLMAILKTAMEGNVELLNRNHFCINMSSSGNPYDNAFAESFMKTLKRRKYTCVNMRASLMSRSESSISLKKSIIANAFIQE